MTDIDAAIALIMCIARTMQEAPRSVYEARGVLTF